MCYSWRMNRRGFLGSMVGLPLAAMFAQAVPQKPQKLQMSTLYGQLGDSWFILTPQELRKAGFEVVETPVFPANGQNYCIKTKKLHLWLPPERVGAPIPRECKEEAIRQIRQIGFTHIYCVKFNESPIYDVPTCKSIGHMAFVRGATV